MTTNPYTNLMLRMARESGEIALGLMANSKPTLKPDKSVLTKADTQISSFIRKSLKNFLTTQEHLLIDEEDAGNIEYFNQSYLKSRKYIWVIDPIDGTIQYANRMPLFGISIGLLKDLRPWLGVVYFPYLGELFFCDGRKSYFVKDVFTKNQKRRTLFSFDQKITSSSSQSIFLLHDNFFEDYGWDYSVCPVMISSCAVVDLCWPTIGRGCGSVFKAHVWDFAGAWPICRSAGLNFRSLKNGKILDRLDIRFFEREGTDPWKLKEDYILSSEKNFKFLKSKIGRIKS